MITWWFQLKAGRATGSTTFIHRFVVATIHMYLIRLPPPRSVTSHRPVPASSPVACVSQSNGAAIRTVSDSNASV